MIDAAKGYAKWRGSVTSLTSVMESINGLKSERSHCHFSPFISFGAFVPAGLCKMSMSYWKHLLMTGAVEIRSLFSLLLPSCSWLHVLLKMPTTTSPKSSAYRGEMANANPE